MVPTTMATMEAPAARITVRAVEIPEAVAAPIRAGRAVEAVAPMLKFTTRQTTTARTTTPPLVVGVVARVAEITAGLPAPSVHPRGGGGGGAGWIGGGGGASDHSAGGGGGAGSSLIAGAAPGGIQTFATDTSGSPYATVYWIDITTSSLGSGSINHAYSDQVAGTFGAATAVTGSGAQWTVSPSLPAGLTLDPTTGAISGTPTVASPSSRYTFTATWSSGGLLLAQTSKALTLSIASPSTPTTGTTTTAGGQLAKTGDQSALLLLGGGALVCAGAIASRSLRRRRSRSL